MIQRALAGDVTRELYVAFLTQAYHHVRHTVPLLMAVGARVPDRHGWLRDAILHYLEEETGHDEWILNDIARAGGDRAAAAASEPVGGHRGDGRLCVRHRDARATRSASSAWCTCSRAPASRWRCMPPTASRQALGLPVNAFTYLRSHGELDKQHINDLGAILERLTDEEDRRR